MASPFDPSDEDDQYKAYAPRSRARLQGRAAALEGEDVGLPTVEEIEAAAGDDEAMQALLSRAKYAEARLAKASGNNYAMDGGHGNIVANPWGAISDIFVRGQAMKQRDEAYKSASEMGKAQRAAAAKLARGDLARAEQDKLYAELRELDEADRKDAQAVAGERVRVNERNQDLRTDIQNAGLDEAFRRDQLRQQAQLEREGFGSAERIANIRASNARKDAKADADAASAAEIQRQVETALAIAETRVEQAGTDGGPVMGRIGSGALDGDRDAFDGDMAPISNSVRAQIRRHFKDSAQSNQELTAFEANIPKWSDTQETRAKKLQNIREMYAPDAIRARAENGTPLEAPKDRESVLSRYRSPNL